MPAAKALTIPEIRAFLAVRSGLTNQTAADEAGLTGDQVDAVLARLRRTTATTTRGRTRR